MGFYLLQALLKEGCESIVAIKRATSSMMMAKHLDDGIFWSECPLTNEVQLNELVSESDVIIHAASLVSFDPSERNEMFQTNIEGTARLVNVALNHSIEKFIYVSSVAALGTDSNQNLISEGTEWVESEIHQLNLNF